MYKYCFDNAHLFLIHFPNIVQILCKYCQNIEQIFYYFLSVIEDTDKWIQKTPPFSQRLRSHWATWPKPALWLVHLGRSWKWPSWSRIFLGVGVSLYWGVRTISHFGDPSQKCITKKFKGGGTFFMRFYAVREGGQPHFKKIKRNDFLTKVEGGGGVLFSWDSTLCSSVPACLII